MKVLNNNTVAVFAVMLILLSLSGQIMVHKKVREIEESYSIPEVTGKASATGTISLRVMRPLTDLDFRAILDDDNSTVVLLWENITQDNASIFITDNISAGFDLMNPNVSGYIGFNWSDPTAGSVPERYYKLGIWNDGNFDISVNSVGKFDIPIYHSTQIPGEVELNTISIPLEPYDLSLDNIFRWSKDFDTIMTYNPFKVPDPGFDGVLSVGNTWFGDFSEINISKGYWLGIVDTPYNLTIVGSVPTDTMKIHLYGSTQIPGEIELNTVNYHSAYTNFNLSVVLESNVTDGDTLMTYNPFKVPDPGFDGIVYFNGFGWIGDFACLEAGKGYTFGIVGSEYDWEYEPVP